MSLSIWQRAYKQILQLGNRNKKVINYAPLIHNTKNQQNPQRCHILYITVNMNADHQRQYQKQLVGGSGQGGPTLYYTMAQDTLQSKQGDNRPQSAGPFTSATGFSSIPPVTTNSNTVASSQKSLKTVSKSTKKVENSKSSQSSNNLGSNPTRDQLVQEYYMTEAILQKQKAKKATQNDQVQIIATSTAGSRQVSGQKIRSKNEGGTETLSAQNYRKRYLLSNKSDRSASQESRGGRKTLSIQKEALNNQQNAQNQLAAYYSTTVKTKRPKDHHKHLGSAGGAQRNSKKKPQTPSSHFSGAHQISPSPGQSSYRRKWHRGTSQGSRVAGKSTSSRSGSTQSHLSNQFQTIQSQQTGVVAKSEKGVFKTRQIQKNLARPTSASTSQTGSTKQFEHYLDSATLLPQRAIQIKQLNQKAFEEIRSANKTSKASKSPIGPLLASHEAQMLSPESKLNLLLEKRDQKQKEHKTEQKQMKNGNEAGTIFKSVPCGSFKEGRSNSNDIRRGTLDFATIANFSSSKGSLSEKRRQGSQEGTANRQQLSQTPTTDIIGSRRKSTQGVPPRPKKSSDTRSQQKGKKEAHKNKSKSKDRATKSSSDLHMRSHQVNTQQINSHQSVKALTTGKKGKGKSPQVSLSHGVTPLAVGTSSRSLASDQLRIIMQDQQPTHPQQQPQYVQLQRQQCQDEQEGGREQMIDFEDGGVGVSKGNRKSRLHQLLQQAVLQHQEQLQWGTRSAKDIAIMFQEDSAERVNKDGQKQNLLVKGNKNQSRQVQQVQKLQASNSNTQQSVTTTDGAKSSASRSMAKLKRGSQNIIINEKLPVNFPVTSVKLGNLPQTTRTQKHNQPNLISTELNHQHQQRQLVQTEKRKDQQQSAAVRRKKSSSRQRGKSAKRGSMERGGGGGIEARHHQTTEKNCTESQQNLASNKNNSNAHSNSNSHDFTQARQRIIKPKTVPSEGFVRTATQAYIHSNLQHQKSNQQTNHLATINSNANNQHHSQSQQQISYSAFRMRMYKPGKRSEKVRNCTDQRQFKGEILNSQQQIQRHPQGTTVQISGTGAKNSTRDRSSQRGQPDHQKRNTTKKVKSSNRNALQLAHMKASEVANGTNNSQAPSNRKDRDKKNTQRIDLMKAAATLMTDIRIEPKTATHSQVNNSQKVMLFYPQQNNKNNAAYQSLDSTPKGQNEFVTTNKHSKKIVDLGQAILGASDSTTPRPNQITKHKNRDHQNVARSPKFLLSLRQLENLLFSTQQIGQKLQNDKNGSNLVTNQSKASKQVSTHDVIRQEDSTTGKIGKSITKENNGAQKSSNRKNNDQFIQIQPSCHVFNMPTERSSAEKQSLNSKTKSFNNSSSLLNDRQLHQNVILDQEQVAIKFGTNEQISTKSLHNDDLLLDNNNHLGRGKYSKTSGRQKIKNSLQASKNLLSLLQMQKLRARGIIKKQKGQPQMLDQELRNEIDQNSDLKSDQEQSQEEEDQQNQEASQGSDDQGEEFQDSAKLSEENERNQQELDQHSENGQKSVKINQFLFPETTSTTRVQNMIYRRLESRQNSSQQNSTSKSIEAPPNSPPQQIGKENTDKILIKERVLKIEETAPIKLLQPNLKVIPYQEYVPLKSEKDYTPQDSYLERSAKASFLESLHEKYLNESQNKIQQAESTSRNQQNNLNSSRNQSHQSELVSQRSSLKQPSLRQITNSLHTSSGKHLNRNYSTDLPQNQDPNTSITLSKILLETSMNQNDCREDLQEAQIKRNQNQKPQKLHAKIVQLSQKNRLQNADRNEKQRFTTVMAGIQSSTEDENNRIVTTNGKTPSIPTQLSPMTDTIDDLVTSNQIQQSIVSPPRLTTPSPHPQSDPKQTNNLHQNEVQKDNQDFQTPIDTKMNNISSTPINQIETPWANENDDHFDNEPQSQPKLSSRKKDNELRFDSKVNGIMTPPADLKHVVSQRVSGRTSQNLICEEAQESQGMFVPDTISVSHDECSEIVASRGTSSPNRRARNSLSSCQNNKFYQFEGRDSESPPLRTYLEDAVQRSGKRKRQSQQHKEINNDNDNDEGQKEQWEFQQQQLSEGGSDFGLAPYEKSQHEGLDLILFQGNRLENNHHHHPNCGGEASQQQDQQRNQNQHDENPAILSSIVSQGDENNSSNSAILSNKHQYDFVNRQEFERSEKGDANQAENDSVSLEDVNIQIEHHEFVQKSSTLLEQINDQKITHAPNSAETQDREAADDQSQTHFLASGGKGFTQETDQQIVVSEDFSSSVIPLVTPDKTSLQMTSGQKEARETIGLSDLKPVSNSEQKADNRANNLNEYISLADKNQNHLNRLARDSLNTPDPTIKFDIVTPTNDPESKKQKHCEPYTVDRCDEKQIYENLKRQGGALSASIATTSSLDPADLVMIVADNKTIASPTNMTTPQSPMTCVSAESTPQQLSSISPSKAAAATFSSKLGINSPNGQKQEQNTHLVVNQNQQGSSPTISALSPLKQSSQAKEVKKFDIDSLNEIKRANDLASKKVEITNHIFDMIVAEVRQDLFPNRTQSQNELQPSKIQTLKSRNDQKTNNSQESPKNKTPRSLPKIKELVCGQPVDADLKNIQKSARSLSNSGQLTTQTKSSKSTPLSVDEQQNLGRISPKISSALKDQVKNETKLQFQRKLQDQQITNGMHFHAIELKKQEQLDFLTQALDKLEEEHLKKEEKKKMQKKADRKKAKLALKKGDLQSRKDVKKDEDEDNKSSGNLKELQLNLRGIKTTTDVTDQYLNTLFEVLLSNEQDFLDSLATPFISNPVQEISTIQHLSKQSKQIKAKVFDRKTNQQQELESALFGSVSQQNPVLLVELYLDIERRKGYVLLADSISEIISQSDLSDSQSGGSDQQNTSSQKAQEKANRLAKTSTTKPDLIENQSMLAEWENIHNKVLFDAVNDTLDEFRPYGVKGPPAPWSGQTRALTYRYSQNAKEVLQQVKDKVVSLSKTFGGALANSELLKEYHIRGPLENDKLAMLREERLAIMMMQDVEETQYKWEDVERQETGVRLDVADAILEQLAAEIAQEMTQINSKREQMQQI